MSPFFFLSKNESIFQPTTLKSYTLRYLELLARTLSWNKRVTSLKKFVCVRAGVGWGREAMGVMVNWSSIDPVQHASDTMRCVNARSNPHVLLTTPYVGCCRGVALCGTLSGQRFSAPETCLRARNSDPVGATYRYWWWPPSCGSSSIFPLLAGLTPRVVALLVCVCRENLRNSEVKTFSALRPPKF